MNPNQTNSDRLIPNRYVFVWFGSSFPYSNYLALKSVFKNAAADEIALYIADPLGNDPVFSRCLAEIPTLRVIDLNIHDLLKACAHPEHDALLREWEWLLDQRFYAALSDYLRYLLLYLDGGIYLDFDILALEPAGDLLLQNGFAAREHILVSAQVARTRKWPSYFRSVPLDLLRWVCARTQNGVTHFRKVAPYFVQAINGAVLGLSPAHPLAYDALGAMLPLTRKIPERRPIIGPDLLQDLLAEPNRYDVSILPPDYFYPLGPTMAEQYFRPNKDVARLEREVVSDRTTIIHWYNDSNIKGMLPQNDEQLHRLAANQLFSRLALPLIED